MATQTADPDEAADGIGAGGNPHLTLDGFTGPLDHLLTLARAHKIDLSDISVTALVEQLATALRQAPATTSLEQKGDWVVMAAWLVQLRAQLLLPTAQPAQQEAAVEADQLRDRLVALQAMQALAGWLQRRPQLGHDVFARGQPEVFGVSVETAHAIDVVEFLWASLALFDDDVTVPEAVTVYRPVPRVLHTVAHARERIIGLLQETPEDTPFERLLPESTEGADRTSYGVLQRCSGWASTLVASLELAKQGDVVLR